MESCSAYDSSYFGAHLRYAETGIWKNPNSFDLKLSFLLSFLLTCVIGLISSVFATPMSLKAGLALHYGVRVYFYLRSLECRCSKSARLTTRSVISRNCERIPAV